MNTSRKTKLIADGIALWATVQDLPGNALEGSSQKASWDAWAKAYPQWVVFVHIEQFQLFDRVNATF